MRNFILLAALFVSACGGSTATAPTPPVVVEVASANGSWSGSSNGGTLTMVLGVTGNVVNGAGQFSAGTTSIALSITGTAVGSAVGLTMTATGFQTMNYTGTFNGLKQLVGTLNGSGFNNSAFVFNKQ